MTLAIRWLPALFCLPLLSTAVQAGDAAPAPVPGFFDPKTQTFTALVEAPSPQAAAAAPKVIQGTMTLKATVTLGAAVPASTTFRANGYATGGSTYASSPSTGASYGTAGGDGTATRSSSTATVTLTFPYHMSVDASATTLSLGLSIYPSAAGVPSLQFTKVIPIPANGATTVVNFPGAL